MKKFFSVPLPLFLLPLAAFSLALPASGQERPVEAADLPRHVAEQVVSFFNDPSTVRFSGETSIPATRVIVGSVAVTGGPLRLAGEIDGTLVVMNGNLELQRGATVTGDVMVLGGRVTGADEAFIGGTLSVYEERLRYERRGERIVQSGPRREVGPVHESRFGGSRFTFRTGTSYNRVEGLPVMFGPVIETEGLNPLRIEGLGIWRSTSGMNLVGEELGYSVLLEQRLFARRDAGVGVTLHSQVLPMDGWVLSDLESSLATFLLRRDYRDYYDARGWSGYVRSGIPGTALTMRLEFSEEEHRYAPVGNPWSLRGGDDPWRPQPLVGEGRTQSIGAAVAYDTRNETLHPSAGWLIGVRFRAGVGGSLTLPGYTVPALGAPAVAVPPRELDRGYEVGFVDLRRYNRVSPSSRLNIRVLAGGSLTGNALPPQFQHALGGEGSLPGHRHFAGDCGARSREGRVSTTVRRGENRGEQVIVPTFGAYGCDRIALFQMEYQGDFGWNVHRSLRSGHRSSRAGVDDWEWRTLTDLRPNWSVFFNTGRGWALPDRLTPDPTLLRADSETMMDLGVGIFFGGVGLYWAVPLDSGDSGVNFFVRLSQRF